MAFGGKVRVVRSIALAIILVMILGDFSFAIDRTARAAGMHERSKLAAELMQHAEKQDAALKSVNPLNPDPLGVRRKQVEQAQREELARRAGPNGKAVRGSTSAGMRQINPNDSNLSPELKKMIADMKSGKRNLNGANENIKATDSAAMMEQIKKAESPEIAKFLIEMYNESAKEPLTWKGLAELGLDVKAIKAAGLLLADESGAPINSDNSDNKKENDNMSDKSNSEQFAVDMEISFYNSALTSDFADSESAEAEISSKDLEAPIVESVVDNSPASVESSVTETKNDEPAQNEPSAVGFLTGKKVESVEEISAGASDLMQNAAQTPAMTTESGVATKTGIAGADDMQYGAQRDNNALHSWRRARMEVGDALNLTPYFRDISHKPGGMVALTKVIDGRIASISGTSVVGLHWGKTQVTATVDGSFYVLPLEVRPKGAVAVPQVALGGHCIALKSDGSVWAWGLNIYGQLGDGTNTNKTTPVRVTGPAGYGNLMGVVAVSVGAWYSMALSTDGKVWTWGRNNYGQLADGTTEDRNTPAWARGENGSGHLTGVVAISAGHSHSMALKADGTVWTWGRNDYGQIGDGTSAAISSNPHHKKVFPVQVKGANGIWKLTDIVAVAAGDSHSMALKSDGSVWTWGNNNDGQIGDGTASTKPNDPNYKKVLPVQVMNSDGNGYLSDVVYVAPGDYYSMAIKSDRSVWTWGNNRYGQIGDGTAPASPDDPNYKKVRPVQVKGANGNGYLSDIVASAGKDHSIALKSDGSVWTWGLNRFGELGDGASGDDSSKVTPVQVKGAGGSGYLTDITAVAAGYYCSMAIKSNGSVWAWGSNGQGQLGDGTTTARTTPVEVSAQPLKVDYASIIDRNAGVPIEIFDENNPMPPVIRIKANQKFKVDRSKITRYPGFNLIYDSTPVNPSKTSFEITDGRIAAATSEGEVVPTGTAYGCTQLIVKDTESGIIRVIPIGVMPEGRVAVPQVASGESYNIALKADGTVWAWGCNEYGQLGDGTSGSGTEKSTPVQVKGAAGNGYLTNVVAVAAGDSHSMALKSDGSVWTWGRNNYGQIGNAASGDDMNETTPVQVKGVNGNGYLAGIVDIAIGYNHSMALKTDGTVWAWGRNARGELGNGTTTQSTVPVQVKGESGIGYLSDAVSIAAGADHSIALKSDGTVWAWGNGVDGQLGDGTSGVGVDKSTPVQVKGPGGNGYLTDVVAVAAGYNHSMALKTDGSVWAWGFNIYGQLGDGTNTNRTTPVQVKGPGGNGYLTDVVAVAAGRYHSMALKTDGSVWAWGYNYYGLIGDGTAANTTTPVQVKGASGIGYLSKVVAVAAGLSQNIVIKTDGSVWTWASNEYGQLGDGTTTYRATPVMVSDNKLQISPEQVTIYPSATEAFTASFKSFNLFNDGETPPGDYEWSIEDERDENGIEKPGEILQFAIEGGHPIPGTVKGKGIGTAKVKVINKATGHDAAFASVEVVALGGDRPLDIKVEEDTANATALENAVASNELDADEYSTITDPVSGAVVGYALHTDPAQGKVLKGIYTVLVHVEGVKGTVRVKSFINTDDICLEDKAGNAIPGVGTRKITDPDSPYVGYFEFTDVPLVKFISAYYLRFYNQGDNALTTNPNYYNGVYKLSITLYSEDNEEPMVEVDDNLLTKLNMGEAGYEGSYKYVLPAGKSEVKVQLTTSISGADVKIGDFESEHTSSTRNVTVDIDPETGVQNVVLSVHESGGAAVHNYKLILVSQDADTSLNKLEIKRIDGSIISDSYLPKYDFARNAYVVNVKDNAENVRIYAYPSNINAKAAVAADRAAALAAAGTVVVGTLDTPLQSGENRFYIAVTPSTHDSDMHYPKEVHELIINRMPANNEETLAHLKLVDETEEGDGLYELDPDFDANIENYEATVDPLAKSIEFEFTTNVPGARLNMTLGDQVFKSATGSLKNSFALALDTATFEAVFEVRVPADPGDPTSVPRYGRYRVLIKRDGVDAGDVASVQTSIMGTIKTYAENDHSATIRLYDKNGELVELDSAGNTEYQVGEDGIFEIKLPEAGEYKMLISKAGYLSYTVNDIVISETFVKAKYDFETISLGAGDLVDDGESKDVIDEADIEAAVTALEDTSAIDLAKYDLNGDGVFDGEDVNIISFNVGVTAFEVSNLDVDNVAHAILRRY